MTVLLVASTAPGCPIAHRRSQIESRQGTVTDCWRWFKPKTCPAAFRWRPGTVGSWPGRSGIVNEAGTSRSVGPKVPRLLPEQVRVLFQPLLGGLVFRTNLLDLPPETGRVVHFPQMHQFVQDHVGTDKVRCLDQPPV